MAIEHLTEEQIRTWTREQKDTWWLTKVYRGSMRQLTVRAAITGFLLGGILSATNLYVGAKSGWTLGVGLTSVILAFAVFRVMARVGFKDMTILENNATQSVATAAGYMTGPLISGMAAYMWIQNEILPWHQMMVFNVVLSLLGVLVAFPMKRRFINDEQHPFPEGRACGVVLDTLYTSAAATGMFKAKALAISAAIVGVITFVKEAAYLRFFHAVGTWLGSGTPWNEHLTANKEKLEGTWHLPENVEPIYDAVGEPAIAGVPIRQLGLTPALDLAMFGAGGLLGVKAGVSMMIGMLLNFAVIVPWMITLEEIRPLPGTSYEAGDAAFSRPHVVNHWALWWGISIMVSASMVSLFAKPQVFVNAFRMLTGKGGQAKAAAADPLRDIELPLWVSWVGVPVIGAIGVVLANYWFGVPFLFGALSIPLIIVLTLIAVSSTALTSITPTGSLSKIPQFIFGAANPTHPPTNLMTGVMCVEVASNASNLLMDIKPGYMLGAKPRQQALAHCIGILSGALASTPLFYLLFLSKRQPGESIQEAMVTDQFGFPSALQWKGVSDLVAELFGGGAAGPGASVLTPSIIWSMVIAAIVGVGFEIARILTRSKFPLSPLAIGLGVVVPPDSTMAMFAGAMFFWLMARTFTKRPESTGNRVWVQSLEPICAGIIAGAALVSIGAVLIGNFVLAPLD